MNQPSGAQVNLSKTVFMATSYHVIGQAHPNPSVNWTEWLLAQLYLPNPLAEEVPNKPLDYYTCPFKMSKLDRQVLYTPTRHFTATDRPSISI